MINISKACQRYDRQIWQDIVKLVCINSEKNLIIHFIYESLKDEHRKLRSYINDLTNEKNNKIL